MSNALAIAAVTAVLKDLLNNGLIGHDLASAVGAVTVTAKPPDLITTGVSEAAQLNLFMYHATENAGWRNVGLPAMGVDGQRLANPPLPLNLHYLLMAYGAAEFQAEILLGYAMHLLHENPVLGRDAIRTALAPPAPVGGSELPPAYQALSAADLADQVELIKLSPEALSVEDLSKLWTAFGAKYRPTAAYQASVVLIQGTRSTRSALPVRNRKFYALPFKQPMIDRVFADVVADSDPRVTLASTLVLAGRQLRGPVTLVRLGDLLVPPPPLDVSDTQIRLSLASLTSLRAGVQGVQVVQTIPMGEPETPHRGMESNVAAFVLHPTITATAGITARDVVDSVTLCSGSLTVGFAPKVGRAQRVQLLLNEFDAPETRPSRAYSFPAPRDNGILDPDQPDTDSVAFAISRVQGGEYLVRVQVDGAESLLGHTADGKYASPRVSIT